MFNRKLIFTFTLLTLALAIVLNYRFFYIGFGMFYFIPIFGILWLYPKWFTGIACCIIMPIIRIIMEYISHSNLSYEFLIRLVITSTVSWLILLTVTFIIIKLSNLIRRLEYLSLTDSLTKAFNRRYLELYSDRLLAESLKHKKPLCFIILDIDQFKSINDNYSHNAGDFVLHKLASIIKRVMSQEDIFVRFGGEEFVLILPNTHIKEGLKFAERIRKVIQMAYFEFQGVQIPVTVSIGITKYSGGSLEKLYYQADQALYQSKTNGRNQVTAFSLNYDSKSVI